MKVSFCHNLKDWWLDTCPKKPCHFCCKIDRRQQDFMEARAQLLQEINICDIIKSRRFVAEALKQLMDFKLMHKLQKKSHYISIGLDEG